MRDNVILNLNRLYLTLGNCSEINDLYCQKWLHHVGKSPDTFLNANLLSGSLKKNHRDCPRKGSNKGTTGPKVQSTCVLVPETLSWRRACGRRQTFPPLPPVILVLLFELYENVESSSSKSPFHYTEDLCFNPFSLFGEIITFNTH